MNPRDLTNEELDKLIQERIFKECWHETWYQHNNKISSVQCWKCGRETAPYDEGLHIYIFDNPSYTTNPADYWRLLERIAVDNEQLRRFFEYHSGDLPSFSFEFFTRIINMRTGCELAADFFCKEEVCQTKTP